MRPFGPPEGEKSHLSFFNHHHQQPRPGTGCDARKCRRIVIDTPRASVKICRAARWLLMDLAHIISVPKQTLISHQRYIAAGVTVMELRFVLFFLFILCFISAIRTCVLSPFPWAKQKGKKITPPFIVHGAGCAECSAVLDAGLMFGSEPQPKKELPLRHSCRKSHEPGRVEKQKKKVKAAAGRPRLGRFLFLSTISRYLTFSTNRSCGRQEPHTGEQPSVWLGVVYNVYFGPCFGLPAGDQTPPLQAPRLDISSPTL